MKKSYHICAKMKISGKTSLQNNLNTYYSGNAQKPAKIYTIDKKLVCMYYIN